MVKQNLKKQDPPLTYIEAMDIIGGLSQPSKMPWFSWSISAFDCNTGGKLRKIKGSVCESCYACKGNYRFSNVTNAHARRLQALSHPRFVEAFRLVLYMLHERTKKTYLYKGKKIKENRFRWHDSGDLQNMEHLNKIVLIAQSLPHLRFWLPTKEVGIVNKWLKKNKQFPWNLTVRVSNPMKGVDFKQRPMGLSYSTVGVTSKNVQQCPAPNQGNQCLDCRQCWESDINVNYSLH